MHDKYIEKLGDSISKLKLDTINQVNFDKSIIFLNNYIAKYNCSNIETLSLEKLLNQKILLENNLALIVEFCKNKDIDMNELLDKYEIYLYIDELINKRISILYEHFKNYLIADVIDTRGVISSIKVMNIYGNVIHKENFTTEAFINKQKWKNTIKVLQRGQVVIYNAPYYLKCIKKQLSDLGIEKVKGPIQCVCLMEEYLTKYNFNVSKNYMNECYCKDINSVFEDIFKSEFELYRGNIVYEIFKTLKLCNKSAYVNYLALELFNEESLFENIEFNKSYILFNDKIYENIT